jgi:hypothetical protein
MRKEYIALFIVFFVATHHVLGQNGAAVCDMKPTAVVEGIRRGDLAAIRCASLSEDREVFNALQETYRSAQRRQFGVQALRQLQIALSKIGDLSASKEVICETRFGAPRARLDAADALTSIGGWLAISEFNRALDSTPENSVPIGHDDDLIYPSMRALALRELPQVVSHPPVPPPTPLGLNTESLSIKASIWRQWQRERKAG